MRNDSVRFYSEDLEGGNYHLSYAAQAIGKGEFLVPPVRAEEMYSPETYGLSIEGQLKVSE